MLALLALPAAAQISPGELAKPHEQLEGMKNCMQCHKLGAGPSEEKCLECHQEIAVRMKAKKGYHHVATSVEGQACFACHSDHAGRNFKLINWPGGRDNFDHTGTGWDLEGAHRKAKCRDCHNEELIRDDLAQFKSVDLARTFLGLHETCMSCHHDEHRGQLEDDCTRCHGNEAWKPTTTFDHARTAYPLTGAHARVACAKCHAAEKDPQKWDKDNVFARFKPVTHSNCTPCHKDAHAGKFGDDCARCHGTTKWRSVNTASFDHSRTSFPLEGRHRSVACEKCHTSGSHTTKIAFASCTDCHRDSHNGQFASRKDGGRCESCHDVHGFRPARFTLADHERTKFPLQGAHLAQPCIACHKPVEASTTAGYVQYRFEKTNCEACHFDIHYGQLKPKSCETCHMVDNWHQLTFDHDRNTSYRLEGEHRRVACNRCHLQDTEGGNTFIRFKPIDPSCKTCHTREGLELRSG